MSEGWESEDFKQYKEEQRARRAERLPRRTALVKSLEKFGYTVENKTDYHFRITQAGSKKIIDVYPIHLNWHDITKHTRGSVSENKLIDFINKKFDNH